MYLLLAVILCGLELIYEGLKYKGHHVVSGMFEFIYRALIVVGLYALIAGNFESPWALAYSGHFWIIIGAFVLFRFGCFDPLIALVMGEPINYIGTTKWYDQVIGWFIKKTRMGTGHFFFIRLCLFIIGVLILIYANSDKI
jgi:hypothetical protein